MSKIRSLTRFAVVSALGFIVLASLVPGGFAWPTVQDHSPSETGSFYGGDPELAEDIIIGRLRGHGQYNQLWDKGPWGDGTTSGRWNYVDTFLPVGGAEARWNYGDTTYEVDPEYFVKRAAVDTSVTLDDGGGSLVNLKTTHSHTIDTPFETWRASDTQDSYSNTRFVVEPGSVNFQSTDVVVTGATPTGTSSAGPVGVGGLDPVTNPVSLMKQQDFDPYELSAFAFDFGAGIASVGTTLIGDIYLPFTDYQLGDYTATLTLWSPKTTSEMQLGPHIEFGGAGGVPIFSALQIYTFDIIGTNAKFFFDTYWESQPPASSGGINLGSFVEERSSGETIYGRSELRISWTRSTSSSPLYITEAGLFAVHVVSVAIAGKGSASYAMVSSLASIDYMGVKVTYSDKISGVSPSVACFPVDVKLSTGEPGAVGQKTGVWDFGGPFMVNEAVWTIERCSDFVAETTAVAQFKMQSVTADYYSYKSDPNRISGMDLILNEDTGRPIIMEDGDEDGVYTTTLLNLDSYFIYNDPTVPAGTAKLRLRLDIVGGGGEYQVDPYNFDDIIFRFRASYTELYAPISIPFTGPETSITIGLPDMFWMSGNFDRFLTSTSAYVIRLDAPDGPHYPMLDPAPVFIGFEEEPDDPNPDLPVWDMSFQFYKPWNAQHTNPSFTLTCTMDNTIPSAGPTWPVPDVGSNGILNVGSEVFEVAYADQGLPDAQSPIVAAILWWEYTVDEVPHREYLEMTGPNGVLKAGVASGIISPELFTVGITYSFSMEIIDGGGNFVVTPARGYIIIQETAPPVIYAPIVAGDTLVYGPAAGIPSFHASVLDANLDPNSVKLIVAGSEFQMTDLGDGYFGLMSSPGGVAWDAWVTCWSGLSSGEYSAFLYAADTYPHSSWIPFTIVKDHETPSCSILGPFEDGDYVSGAPVVLLHILDSVSWVEKVWYSFAPSPTQSDGSWRAAEFDAHPTLPGGEDILIAVHESDWLLVPQGSFRLSFTIGDTGRNNATIQYINLIKDSIAPNLILDLPATGSMWNGTAPTFRFLIADSELYLAQVGYQVGPCDARYIDLALGVFSPVAHAWVFNGTLSQEDWESLDNETDITVSFFAIDGANNQDIESRTITVDKEGPRIRIIAPAPASIAGGFAVSYLLEVDEPHLQGLWYSLDGGTTLIPITELNAVFDQAKWDAAAGTREMQILFIGRDTLGNWGYAEVTVIRSDYSEGGLPWQVGICMAGAAGVLFSINAWNKKRAGGR